jgi:tryptophan halogenase
MKVVIVGGGTSAWMTAAAFCKTFPSWEITLIQGGKPVGVGESTTPHINQYLHYMGIDDKTFLKAAKATYKSSSRFEDFSGLGEVFHYPNGQTLHTDVMYHEWMIGKTYTTHLPSFAEVFMPFVTVAEEGKLPVNHPLLDPYDLNKDRSFHIDGEAFSKYLKDTYCRHLKVVDSKVKSVRYKGRDITSVVVEGGNYFNRGQEIFADLYIDCSGQQAVLGKGRTTWTPFDTILTDTAILKKTEYSVFREAEMVPYTNAKGMSSGWQWTIPTWDYISNGYVFSSKYQDLESAVKEFGHEEIRVVTFKNGRHDKAWVGNCVMIGLSYGFIEPLESTSLFNTGHGILALMDILTKEQLPGQFARDRYNHNLAEHMDGWREFVEAHYYYSKRRDTPFWRAVTDEVEYKMEGAHRVMLEAMVTGQEIEHGQDPIVYILAGSGYTNVNSRLDSYFGNPPAVDEFDAQDMYLKYQKVKELASSMPSMASYLQETVWS